MLPSDPLIATELALVAVTVSVDDAPGAIDVGFAVIVTVAEPGRALALEPHPVTRNMLEVKAKNIETGTRQQR